MGHVTRGDSPRAVVHTRILDVAEERPEASLAEIAGEVSAATPDLVDRVLEEYGDPADATKDSDTHASMSQDVTSDATAQNGQDDPSEDDPTEVEAGTGDSDDQAPESSSSASPLSMTDKQRETLVAVHERPEASQGEIADALDVTRATVSRRLNDLDGFSWDERADFASAHLDSAGVAGADDVDTADVPTRGSVETAENEEERQPADDPAETAEAETLTDRLADVERRLETVERGPGQPALDPELVHKVAHACMESEAISREEELQVIEHLMR